MRSKRNRKAIGQKKSRAGWRGLRQTAGAFRRHRSRASSHPQGGADRATSARNGTGDGRINEQKDHHGRDMLAKPWHVNGDRCERGQGVRCGGSNWRSSFNFRDLEMASSRLIQPAVILIQRLRAEHQGRSRTTV
jgi:hypothetical protein